jgi:hypothetical protein
MLLYRASCEFLQASCDNGRVTSPRELRDKSDRASPWYNLAIAGLKMLIFRRMRSRLLESAVGRVLEVAAGTGVNWDHYSAGVDIVAGPAARDERNRSHGRGTARFPRQFV